MIEKGSCLASSYRATSSRADEEFAGGGNVGPEATLCSSPFGTSDTIKVSCRDLGAKLESRPPFTAEKARRTAFTSLIEAPQLIRARFAVRRLASVISSLIGHSNIADPPPEIRKITRECSAFARSSNENADCAATRLAFVGSGCPPSHHRKRLESFLGGIEIFPLS